MIDLNGKKVLIAGLGKSGLAAGRLLLSVGASLTVTEINDTPVLRDIAGELTAGGAYVELGRHTESLVRGQDLIAISPGIDPRHCIVGWARRYGIDIISELELGSWFLNCPLICVTGTNGKSTVTCLIAHIFQQAGYQAVAGGNLGIPLSEIAGSKSRIDIAVVEASSFQLRYTKYFKPDISVWLNFSRDHLDYHQTVDKYRKAKLRIFQNQTAGEKAVIYFREADKVKEIKPEKVFFGGKDNPIPAVVNQGPWENTNLENMEAAAAVAGLYGISEKVIVQGIASFRPLPHRNQYIITINGVDFVDDSKATNVNAVRYALEGCLRPVTLILGGRDKGGDFRNLKDKVRDKVKNIIVMGESGDEIAGQLRGAAPIYKSTEIQSAVVLAQELAGPEDIVLLSPGCSSFDMFSGYEERGRKFQEAVGQLPGVRSKKIISGTKDQSRQQVSV